MGELAQVAAAEEARARADRIRSGMRVLAEWQQDVIAAYTARDWLALGYEAWDAYLDGEYGEHRVRLPREQRREIVASMSAAGMSTRAIGAAVGVHHDTANRDVQAAVGNPTPTAVTGIDGKTYARPATEENVWVEPDADGVVDAELVDEPTRVEPPKPKRRPLPEAFAGAGHDLSRAAERFARLTEDDRFARNREAAQHQVPELLGALDQTARLVEALNLPGADASEEARRWWATSLRNTSDALLGIADSLEQEK